MVLVVCHFLSILWLGLERVICHMALFEMVIINSVGALEVDMLQSLMRYCIGTPPATLT